MKEIGKSIHCPEEGCKTEMKTRGLVSGFLQGRGYLVTADLAEPLGQAIVAVAPDGEPMRIRVRVSWQCESMVEGSVVPMVAIDLLDRFEERDPIGEINHSVMVDTARGLTHYLFVHRAGEEILLAGLVPTSEVFQIWLNQQDKIQELGRENQFRELQIKLGKSPLAPILWLRLDPENAVVADEFWAAPSVIDLTEWDSADVGTQLAEEVRSKHLKVFDGSLRRITVNAFEMNAAAKSACIQHYGAKCQICGMDFEQVYGPEATGHIQIHHLKAIDSVSREYQIDPIHDLLPVCHNCHAMLHLDGKTRTVDEVKQMVASRANREH